YIRIQGLTFQNLTCLGSMQQGVKIASSSNYIDILQNKFLHNQNNGAWDGTNALLHFYVRSPASNITVRGNEFGYIVSNYSETLSLYAITGTVVLENNYLHDLDGIGIDVGSGSSNGTVRGNVLEYVSIKRDGTVWYNSPSNAIYV